MARMLLSLLPALLLVAHSHPAGLECATDAATRLQPGKTIMTMKTAVAPRDAPIKVKVEGSAARARVTITSKPGIYFAARAVGDGAKLYVRGTDLNMTTNCSNQVFTTAGNSTTYSFGASGAEGIVVGYASAPGVVSLVRSAHLPPGPAPGPRPPSRFCPEKLQAVYADMHDGDKKEVTIAGSKMTIKPSGNNQTWVVNTELDPDSCSATVDFNVPGKPSPPPCKLTAIMLHSYSGKGEIKTEFEFQDRTGTLPKGPLNHWVDLAKTKPAVRRPPCPAALKAIYADMHDGDKKEVTISGTSMTIKPSGNNQTWVVKADLDTKSCSAVIDFNVPGKPGPPPVNLTATWWTTTSSRKADLRESEFEFTDPSGTLAAADFPLNHWVQIGREQPDMEIVV